MSIQIGDSLPSVQLSEDGPRDFVDPAEALSKGKVVLVGVVGAFTGTCETQLPGYVENYDAFRAKGVDTIAFVSVNDAFVMKAWGESHDVAGKIRMLADPNAEFTKKVGLDVDAAVLGGTRSKRYTMVLQDGKVTDLQVEPDSFGLSACSIAPSVLERL